MAKRITRDTSWNEIRNKLHKALNFSSFVYGGLRILKLDSQTYQIWKGKNIITTQPNSDDAAYWLVNNR